MPGVIPADVRLDIVRTVWRRCLPPIGRSPEPWLESGRRRARGDDMSAHSHQVIGRRSDEGTVDEPLSAEEVRLLDAYWRAANYLSVGQIYLLANPLLREPLLPEHVKPRLLGHWGTTPGLNFLYTHLNQAIRERDLDVIFVSGPGHGGPAVVAQSYLEGT